MRAVGGWHGRCDPLRRADASGREATTVGEPTLRVCEAHVALLKEVKRTDPDTPIVSYRCEAKRPYIGLLICEGRGRQCEHLTPSSRQGCAALAWIAHMRDRSKFGYCYQEPPEEQPLPRGE